MQDSKRVLGFNCKKRIEQINFFDWLEMLKIQFFEMALNSCKMWSNGI